MAPRKILIAPLNWGLGHVARCIPIIQALEKMGVTVILASDGVAFHLLKAEFPHLPIHRLPSYRITYSTPNMVRNIARQIPRILLAIRAEHRATERLVQEHGITHILSDNRYGCFSSHAHSILLTHQLHLRVPNRLLQWLANGLLRQALSKFDRIWVPDIAGSPNLSGALSHGPAAHTHTQYVGILSRMRPGPQEREYDVAVVLSGPEPQRSILENRLLEQAMSLPQKFIFIQGKTQSKQHYFAADNVEVISYLTSKELNNRLLSSRIIVCRSGYSSLMDLAALGKRAILVPTPGQTEQEYLADSFAGQNIFLCQQQDKLNLKTGIMGIGNTTGFPIGQFPTDSFLPFLQEICG